MAQDDDEADALWAAIQPSDDRLAAASAADRSRRRWLGQLATESSTLAGVLVTLAERDRPVTVRCGPWTHTGRLRSATAALCIMELPEVALIATEAITTVLAHDMVVDDRPPTRGADLPTVLATLVARRPEVRLELIDGSDVTGRLLGLGKDTAAVALTSSIMNVRLSALACCVLLGSAPS